MAQQKKLLIEIMDADNRNGLYKQQTAVDWYYEQTIVLGKTNYSELIEQAKQMEKEQMFEFTKKHHIIGEYSKNFYTEEFEKYYNETYGK